ncbi:hypothetical protein AWB77_04815 [Caballeronia fortuita]|uniref:Uncharacterized protein n=1 Tax=Caballeronia fortuita TaxID=1777138 RepID=A0A158D2M0_9BURK|nr:hypothetical protein [Caballeronia fortuita]SAK88731.1 hypothetical protein AWB77_04815 [Caballeronia fortuita]
MIGTDFTQLASDGKRAADSEYEVPNQYNEIYARIDQKSLALDERVPAHTMNSVFVALSGISAITQILTNDATSKDQGREPLSAYLTGGLHSAIQALADLSMHKIEEFADLAERRQSRARAAEKVLSSIKGMQHALDNIRSEVGNTAVQGSAFDNADQTLRAVKESVEEVCRV